MSDPEVVLVDLDGVIWLSDTPIPGADEAVDRLTEAGCRVAFFTNNSYVSTAELLGKLERQGVGVDKENLLSSAAAAATLLCPSDRALVVGGPGCLEALAEAGVVASYCDGQGGTYGYDAVVVGLDPRFDYARLAQAMKAINSGARLIGTNSDATLPVPEGELPGGGSILAAVSTASGVAPVVAGKPNEPAAELVRRRLGHVDLVVGDRPSTDGGFARLLGAEFGLVLTGVTPPDHGALDPKPDREAKDFRGIADDWLTHR